MLFICFSFWQFINVQIPLKKWRIGKVVQNNIDKGIN